MTERALQHVGPGGDYPSLTLREATIEAIVRRAHDRLTGRGDHGHIIHGDAPSRVLAAGMLLPACHRSSADGRGGLSGDATSPIHMATVGMSFQIARDVPGTFRVKPGGAVYVRVLPSVTDLQRQAVTFGLSKDTRGSLRRRKREILARLKQEQAIPTAGLNQEERDKLAGLRKLASEQAWSEVSREIGLPTEVVKASTEDVTIAGEEATIAEGADPKAFDESGEEASEEQEALVAAEGIDVSEEANDSATRKWDVMPEMARAGVPDDSLVDPAEIPQKWLRLEVDWPELVLDPAADEDTIRRMCEAHRGPMLATLRERLQQWAQDPDAETGGLLWGFPRATDQDPRHKVLPTEILTWDTTLVRLRTGRGRLALPDDRFGLRVEVNVADDPLDASLRTVRVVLANRSDVVNMSRVPEKLCDRSVYLAGLEITLDPGLHRDHVLGRVQPSYRWNDWLRHPGLGINCGVDGSRPVESGPSILQTTHLPSWRQPRIVPYALAVKPRFETLAAEDGGIPVLEALVADYEAWLTGITGKEPWRIPKGQPADLGAEARERARFEQDVVAWRRELDRIRIGLEVLCEARSAAKSGAKPNDPRVMPLTAWRATNASFARLSRALTSRGERGPTEWRLFQLAFIAAHLPGITSRIPYWSRRPNLFLPAEQGVDPMAADDATANLLYFPTGGGKSEAFFGLLVLQCFVDRLRGKLRGVTGIVRYPLRLLTAQQANRFARTLAMAELERRALAIPGDPFQIGFWVGGGNTPNAAYAEGFDELPSWDEAALTEQAEAQLRKERGYKSASKWRRLTECPFCGDKSVGLRKRREGTETRLAHVCLQPACDWNSLHGSVEPLPFHVMDTDIYAYAPTVLLGTVDKMAMIAHSPLTIARVFGMFGFAPWVQEIRDASNKLLPGHGRLAHPRRPRNGGSNQKWRDPTAYSCRRVGPVYGNRDVELFDPFPAIEVQDEAHLLEQSLGTFSGLFGSMLETAQSDLAEKLGNTLSSRLADGGPRRAKVIAASATVQGPERHIEMLYQRRVAMFPHPGPDLYESFFARLEPAQESDVGRASLDDVEQRTPTRRLYLSMPTNGRPHTSATVAVLSSLHLTMTEAYRDIGSPDRATRDRVRDYLVTALPTGPLQTWQANALRGATDDALAEAVDLARIVLAYVTNKKGGDSVQAALGEFVPRDHQRAGVLLGETQGVSTGLITGSVEMEKIQEIVERAKPEWKAGAAVDIERDFLAALRGVIATSAISHGVDIERLNIMVFAGLPSDVAEYVQASSRVGRAHVGVSILVPTPQRPRDVHVVGIHDVFHRFLERMIQPAAIDRWGENAIRRVLSSALQVKVCAVDHYRRLCAAADDNARATIWDSGGVPAIGDRLRNDFIGTVDDVAKFLSRAVGIDETNPTRSPYLPTAKDWYVELLRDRTRDTLQTMRSETWSMSGFRTFFEGTDHPMPMMSLRDVDEPGVIRVAERSHVNGRTLQRLRVGALMRMLRRGDGRWGDDESEDEGGEADAA
jgi:hypothetical protein